MPDGCGISECVPVSVSSYPSSAYSSYNYNSASSCPSNLLGSDCHDMGNAFFNGPMDKYVVYGGSTVKNCSTEYINGCTAWGSSSSYSYSSYNYVPPTGQKEQVWNSYGLRSWIRTDADSARIENLKQACANVTYGSGDIWMSGAGDYNSVNFGMPDEAKCRAWTPSSSSSYSYSSYPSHSSSYSSYNPTSSAYSSYSYSSYPSSAYSSYNYSSYYSSSASNCPTSLLGSGCHRHGQRSFQRRHGSICSLWRFSGKSCSTEYNKRMHFDGVLPAVIRIVRIRHILLHTAVMTLQLLASNMEGHGTALIASMVLPVLILTARPVRRLTAVMIIQPPVLAGGTWDGSYCQMPQSSSAYSSYYSSAAPIAAPVTIHQPPVLNLAEHGTGQLARCLIRAVPAALPRIPPQPAGCSGK